MASIPNFKHDIFISYAHEDNMLVFDEEEGWIKKFYKTIKGLLAQKLGGYDAIDIWWDDKKLDGSILFDKSIEEGIQNSAIMLSLLSPSYLRSEYCHKELELFYRKAQDETCGISIDDRFRLLNVLLYKLAFTSWPKALQGKTTGFPFYTVEDETDDSDEGFPLNMHDRSFNDKMYILVNAIVRLLKSMQKLSGGIPGNSLVAVPPSLPFCIYFGDVAESLRALRSRTISDLKKQGYEVIVDVPPPPYDQAAHDMAVKEKLAMANMSIHMLAQSPGAEIEGAAKTWYPQCQTELALTTDKPQMIWLPAETSLESVSESEYKTFLNELEAGKKTSKRIEFVRGAKSELTRQIMELADKIKNPPKRNTGKLAVLLDTHISDLDYADDVGQSLFENGIKPLVNPVEDDPLSNSAVLEERLSKANKLIFLYGRVKRDWVLERMKVALHLIIDKNFPIEDFIIFMVPPHKDSGDISLPQRLIKLDVINSSDDNQQGPAAIEQLMRTIKNAGAVA